MVKQEIKVVEFLPGEVEPLFIRASEIGRVIVGLSPKTLANWRSLGIGPEYHIVNGSVYYMYQTLREFFTQNRVQTTGELMQSERKRV